MHNRHVLVSLYNEEARALLYIQFRDELYLLPTKTQFGNLIIFEIMP